MDRSVELELREDIKEINDNVTNLQVSLNKEMSAIQVSLEGLKIKQNVGAWVFRSMLTIVVATISGIFGAHFTK